MKLLKQIVLILAVVYNQSIGAMEEAIPKVPMPPALKPTLPVRIPRKEKVPTAASQSMPKTYRRLTALITHNEEKFPTSELSGIFEGKSITINSALTSDMADLLSQKAAPILVCGSYLFENILLLKVATEAYIKKDAAWAKGAVAIKQMKEKIQKTYATLYKNKPIQKEDPFFTEYQELLSLAPEKYSTESFNELFVWEIPALYPLDDISKDWLLFEYHSGQQPGPAYLLIPYENADARKPMGDALRGILIEHGFNPGVLRAVSIKDLETELINNKGYSFYTNSMSNQDFAQFSSGVSTVFNQIMTDDPNQPWILWMSGSFFFITFIIVLILF